MSHRRPWFEDVIEEAERNLRDLLDVPDTHAVVFCQGGASLQFSMVAMNLLRGAGRDADYVVTGSWGEKAVQEAEKEGESGSCGPRPTGIRERARPEELGARDG